jgi:hypothetical protein
VQAVADTEVLTGLYVDHLGGAVAAERAGRGELAHWRHGVALERVRASTPVRRVTGTTRPGDTGRLPGFTEDSVVFVALDGDLAVDEIPVSVSPEGLAVHEDLVVVAGSGGFVSFRLRGPVSGGVPSFYMGNQVP